MDQVNKETLLDDMLEVAKAMDEADCGSTVATLDGYTFYDIDGAVWCDAGDLDATDADT